MSRETLLDDAISKAKEADDWQLVEWLRMARGGESAARWYTEKLRDADRTTRKLLNENAKLREELEFERSENGWAREFLNNVGPKCGTKDCPSLVAYVTKLRELVRHLYECTRHNRCSACEYADDACDFEYDLDELGIEVDG